MDRLHGLLMFLNVVETGSFSATARTMGVTTSAVSATIIRLEQKLAVRLLNRTTRSVSPTPEGYEFYERCKGIVSDLEQAELAVSRISKTPSGSLRFAVPLALGRMWVIPRLADFSNTYPAISIEVVMDDFISGLASENIDAAIQVGDIPSSRLTVRKLASVDYVLVASPHYIDARGMPTSIDDLVRHQCITYRRPRNGQIRKWQLHDVSSKANIPDHSFMTFNSGEGLIAAAVSGLGIIQVGRFYAQPLINSGDLVEIMPHMRTHAYDISVVFRQHKRMPPRLRVFINFLVDIFAPPPWDDAKAAGRKQRA
jgi:LysR family transcriptional regulator, regulator for bpeEF and oprC